MTYKRRLKLTGVWLTCLLLIPASITFAETTSGTVASPPTFQDLLTRNARSLTNDSQSLNTFMRHVMPITAAQTNSKPLTLPREPSLPPQMKNPNYEITNWDTNVSETNSVVPRDAMEKWLLKEIGSAKSDIKNTNLNNLTREFIRQKIWELEEQMIEHRAQVESNKVFLELVRTNPMTVAMQPPDLIGQQLSQTMQHYQREASNPTLPPQLRKTFETLANDRKDQLTDHETNAMLWANLHRAQQSKDAANRERAEKELADYLAVKLGKIQGKTYPQGMKLDAIMAEYRKQENGFHWFDVRVASRIILLIFFLVPPLIMIFVAIKRRSSR
jgi:hypothetical protein